MRGVRVGQGRQGEALTGLGSSLAVLVTALAAAGYAFIAGQSTRTWDDAPPGR